jgi:hypothetical protein
MSKVTSLCVLLINVSILNSVQSRSGEHKDVQPKSKLLQYKKRAVNKIHVSCLRSCLQKTCYFVRHILTETPGGVYLGLTREVITWKEMYAPSNSDWTVNINNDLKDTACNLEPKKHFILQDFLIFDFICTFSSVNRNYILLIIFLNKGYWICISLKWAAYTRKSKHVAVLDK